MAWNAGSIVGTAELNTQKWVSGSKLMGSSMAAAAGVAVAGIALIGKAFITATKDSQEFLKAFSNVDTIVDETAVDMQKLAKDVLLLDPALGNATEMTNGLYMAFSAGARTAEEAMDLTITSAKFAKAGLTDLGTAVDAISTAMNAYGAETVSAQYAADLFFQTIQYGKTTGAELAASIGQSIPAFASMGIELDQLTAGLATMTKQGLSTAESTTQLNALTNAFIKPSTAMSEALAAQGIASGSALLETEGLTGALDFLEKVTGGNKEAIAELVPNIRGMKAVFALSGEGAEIYAETLAAMANNMGTVDKAFEEQEKTIETAQNAFKNLSTVAGNLGNTFVNKVAVGATDAAVGMQRFIFSAQGMETVANFAYVFTGALHTLKAILTPLVTGELAMFKDIIKNLWDNIVGLTGGTDGASKAFSFIGGYIKVVMTYLSVMGKVINTIIDLWFDLISVIVEGGKSLALFYAGDIKGSREAAKEFLQNSKDLVRNVKDNAIDIGTTVKDAFNSFGDDAGKVSGEVSDAWNKAAEDSKNFVLENYDELLTGQSAFAQKLSDQRKEQEEKAKEEGKKAGEDIKTENEKAASSFSDVWTKVFDSIAKAAKAGKKITVEEFSNMGNAVLGAVTFGMDTISGFVESYYDQQLGEVESFYDSKITLIEDAYKAEADAAKEAQTEAYSELYNDELDRLKDTLDKRLITKEEYLLAELELQKQFDQQTIDSQAELDEIMANNKLSYEEKQKFVDEYYANVAEKTKAEEEAAKLEVEKKAAEEKNKVAQKAFEAQKAQRISQVWIDAASSQLGYVSWGAPLGPPGWVAAAAAGALALTMAGVQTGLIAAEQYVPSYARGTSNHPGGWAIVGDQPTGRGGELVNMPAGSEVTPTVRSEELLNAMNGISQIGKGGGGMTNVFDFSGANFGNMTEAELENVISTQINETLREVM